MLSHRQRRAGALRRSRSGPRRCRTSRTGRRPSTGPPRARTSSTGSRSRPPTPRPSRPRPRSTCGPTPRSRSREHPEEQAEPKIDRSTRAVYSLVDGSSRPGSRPRASPAIAFFPVDDADEVRPGRRAALAPAHGGVLARRDGPRRQDRSALPQGHRGAAGRPRLPADRQRPRRGARRRGLLRRVLHPRRRLPGHGTGGGRPLGRGGQGHRALPAAPAARRTVRVAGQPVRRQRPGRLGASGNTTRSPATARSSSGPIRRCSAPSSGPCRPAARRRPIRPLPACCPVARPTARSSGTASTTSSATTSGTCAASALHGRRGPSPGQDRRGRRDLMAESEAVTARPSTPPGSGPAWPTSRRVGRRSARTGATPKRSGRRRLFARDDPRVAALEPLRPQGVRRRLRRGHHPVEGAGNEEAIHPYMGAYTTMADLVRGEDEQVVEDFYWYLLHSTAAHAFPEGHLLQAALGLGEHHPARHRRLQLRDHAPPHAGPRGRATNCTCCGAVPDWWLGDGQEIRVERAADAFRADGPRRPRHGRRRGGEVLTAQSHAAEADRPAPAEIAADPGEDRAHRGGDEERSGRAWDFAEVLRRYRSK